MPTRHKRRPKSYDELIAGYYAYGPSDCAPRAELRARAQSLGHDDGELLRPRGNDTYVVRATSVEVVEEYIVGAAPTPSTGSPLDEVIDMPAPPPSPGERMPAPQPAPGPPVGGPAPSAPPAERMPAPSPPVAEPMPAPSPAPAKPAASAQSVDEDDLAADMQAILSGAKVYDPASGRTVARDQVGSAPPPPPPPRPTEVANEQAIFDRIRDSMRYANAYDLGTVELDNRFSDFDRFDDLAKQHRDTKRARPGNGQRPTAEQKVTGKDFLEDLEAVSQSVDETDDPEVRETMGAIGRAAAKAIYSADQSCGPTAANTALAASEREYAAPMYDAGEHVMAGADQYKDALLLGQSPGVRFSYAELLAMGDLFTDAAEMQNASVAELTKLKELIDRSVLYYSKPIGHRDESLDVTHGDWDAATGKRYRRLADDNYEHFAPDVLFGTATTRNHKAAWEQYHRMAIEEAQRLALLPQNQNVSYIPESALIINAFGDHFLTDAFAAGHLVNKGVLIDRFQRNFYASPGKLNSAGEKFFERVAGKAFTGEVKRRFEVLEERRTRCFKHWNIDTTNAFRKLLIGIAEQAPEEVANIAAKTLHDHLNKTGIQVTNGAGHAPWTVMGDGYMNDETLGVMKQAVNQSIANINDPAILADNLNFAPFFDRVWKFTPRLTPASQAEAKRLVGVYTDPNSTVLSDAAAEIISRSSTLDLLIDELVDGRKILQHE